MVDREKVIMGLERHANNNCEYDQETVCPYWGESHCSMHLCSDAIALLKAQESVKPVMCTAHAQGADDVWYECSKCGGFLSVNWNGVKVCKKCGSAVKWDD